MTTRSLLLRVAVAILLMGVVLAGVFRLVERPVSGETDTYTAMFTDANGLRLGDDVRLYGVQVGKVRDVSLDGTFARVRFTVTRDHPLFANSKVAIRYQNLTGFRYLEIQQPDQPGARRDSKTVFGTSETVPPFDITTLFKACNRSWRSCRLMISISSPPACWRSSRATAPGWGRRWAPSRN